MSTATGRHTARVVRHMQQIPVCTPHLALCHQGYDVLSLKNITTVWCNGLPKQKRKAHMHFPYAIGYAAARFIRASLNLTLIMF
eukprot:scaffold17831_cov22-Prasinocladus_malaysianus.AAC.1